MNFSVTQFGKPLSKDKYTWNAKIRTFSTEENELVLDFTNIVGVTFKTGDNCIFKTSHDCVFKTCNHCTFETGSDCTFETGSDCTFKTYDNCTFNTGDECTFDTSSNCTFKTSEECVIVRRDIFEVIQIPKNIKIKLNSYKVPGYTVIKDTKIITIDGKDIEISIESFEAFKKQFIES